MVQGRRKGARLTALTSGGTIPDTADYQVILEPQAQFVGTVNEDFAVESLQGDVFQLGNVVLPHPARRAGPRPRRGCARRAALDPVLARRGAGAQRRAVRQRLAAARASSRRSWRQASRLRPRGSSPTPASPRPPPCSWSLILPPARAALGGLPTQHTIVFERFFDEAGGMQLVIHSPFGSRINRAWGLALRKRFCRTFNFELQAAATEDTIVLSLTTAHSFELGRRRPLSAFQHRAPAAGAGVVRRPDVHDALALERDDRARPAALPRRQEGAGAAGAHDAEDLLTAVFPDQVACAREPRRAKSRFPIIRWCARRSATASKRPWTSRASSGCCAAWRPAASRSIARDLTEPSPLALEVLSARPYAYLDDAPLEERRTQAVMSRRWMDPQSAADIGKLDPQAIARVREEAWPDATSADELHDALLWLTYLTAAEAAARP